MPDSQQEFFFHIDLLSLVVFSGTHICPQSVLITFCKVAVHYSMVFFPIVTKHTFHYLSNKPIILQLLASFPLLSFWYLSSTAPWEVRRQFVVPGATAVYVAKIT